MKDGKMTEKEIAVFNFVKSNGGRASIDDIAEALERSPRSIGPNINAFVSNDLAMREKVEEEGKEKPVTYVVLTDAGMNFVPATEE